MRHQKEAEEKQIINKCESRSPLKSIYRNHIVSSQARRRCSISLVLIDVVVEELGDEVDMSEDHATAAISLEAQSVKGLSIYTRSYFLVLRITWHRHPLAQEDRGRRSTCYRQPNSLNLILV